MNLAPKVEAWFKERNIDAMNFLQGHGIVSDNAITIEDVAPVDINLCHYMIFSGEIEKLLPPKPMKQGELEKAIASWNRRVM